MDQFIAEARRSGDTEYIPAFAFGVSPISRFPKFFAFSLSVLRPAESAEQVNDHADQEYQANATPAVDGTADIKTTATKEQQQDDDKN